MAEYTPTTNGLRNRYLWWYEAQRDRSPSKFTKYPDEVLAEFDRWLAEHDSEVREAERKRIAESIWEDEQRANAMLYRAHLDKLIGGQP